MKIHNSEQEAKLACDKYLELINKAYEETGVREECDDSCCGTSLSAKYQNPGSCVIKTFIYQ